MSQRTLAKGLKLLQHKRVISPDDPRCARDIDNRSRYTVVDPYLRFWLRFLADRIPDISRGRGDLVAADIERAWQGYAGLAVEPLAGDVSPGSYRPDRCILSDVIEVATDRLSDGAREGSLRRTVARSSPPRALAPEDGRDTTEPNHRIENPMGDNSAIEWTDATWNPTTGCDQVSPGCDNCYALTLAKRLKAMGQQKYQRDGDPRTSGPGFGLTIHEDTLETPRRWRKPRRVFVNSMSDLFHPRVPEGFIRRVFHVMADTPRHQYQVLTKRPKRAAALADQLPWPSNIWLGTSIESNAYVSRADELRHVPAAVRFVSLEPLLGPLPDLELDGIHWVIVGGESGPGARPMEPEWVRRIRDRTVAAGVPFFFKQWGGRTPKSRGRELDGRTWDQFPATLEHIA